MSATINVNKRTVVHKTSKGIATTFPDVCKTPSPGGPVPIPYPNVAQSSDTANGSKTVKMDNNPIMLKNSNFSTSTGDEGGSAGGGVMSGKIKGKAEFVNYSFDVKVEGKNVPRLADMMIQNKGSAANTVPIPEVQPPIIAQPPKEQDQDVEGLWVRVLVKVDETPYRFLNYTVKLTDGSSSAGKLDGLGRCYHGSIPPGNCSIKIEEFYCDIEKWFDEKVY